MTHRKIATSLAVAAGLLVFAQGGAEARIACEGNFQNVKGLAVATPYCREWNLARVAQGYGWRVSVQSIRYSESTKAQVCRAIGYDNRVQEICSPYLYNGGNRRPN